MTSQLAWLRTDEGGGDLAGLTGAQLRAVGALWAQAGREVSARFGGDSMRPAIAAGTEVVLRCGRTPDVGEVIAYVLGDQVVLHRLAARGPRGWLIARGDAHVAPDLPVREDALLGVVTAVRGPEGLRPLAPPPRSLARAAALAACRAALAVHPRVCVLLVRGMRWLEKRGR